MFGVPCPPLDSLNRAPPGSRIEAVFTWLGGGHLRELGERHERSTHSVAGVVVLLGAMSRSPLKRKLRVERPSCPPAGRMPA